MFMICIYLFMFVLSWFILDRYTLADTFAKWNNKTVKNYEYYLRKNEPDNMSNENLTVGLIIIGFILYVLILIIAIVSSVEYSLGNVDKINLSSIIFMWVCLSLPIIITPFAVYFLNISLMRYFLEAYADDSSVSIQDMLMNTVTYRVKDALGVQSHLYDLRTYDKKQYTELFNGLSIDSAAEVVKLYQVIHLAKIPNSFHRYLGIFGILCASPFNLFVFIFPNKKEKTESRVSANKITTSDIKRILK